MACCLVLKRKASHKCKAFPVIPKGFSPFSRREKYEPETYPPRRIALSS
jgi:hypothetical protein